MLSFVLAATLFAAGPEDGAQTDRLFDTIRALPTSRTASARDNRARAAV